MKPTYLVSMAIFLIFSTKPTSAQSTKAKLSWGRSSLLRLAFRSLAATSLNWGLVDVLPIISIERLLLRPKNFFSNKNVFGGLGEGRAVQAQFGVKVGKRFSKFGLFGKLDQVF